MQLYLKLPLTCYAPKCVNLEIFYDKQHKILITGAPKLEIDKSVLILSYNSSTRLYVLITDILQLLSLKFQIVKFV